MAISDKTRKLLWGKLGNRCAFCKAELAVDKTALDDDSVIGDECHIVSGKPDGPRHDPSLQQDILDDYSNLLLLCKNDHKMIDDQWETFTVSILNALKEKHEAWVSTRLKEYGVLPTVKIVRVKKNIPENLKRYISGRELLNLVVEGSHAQFAGHDDVKTDEEADLVGGFLQTLRDYGDLDLEPLDMVKTSLEITNGIAELGCVSFLGVKRSGRNMVLFKDTIPFTRSYAREEYTSVPSGLGKAENGFKGQRPFGSRFDAEVGRRGSQSPGNGSFEYPNAQGTR